VSARSVERHPHPFSARPRLNRYTLFIAVIAFSAISPAIPHATTPDASWWTVAIAILCVMGIVGWLGARRPGAHWLNTLAPLLLFPAVHALRCADGNWRAGFIPLILLPVVWFALYGRLRDIWLAVVGGALTVFLPMLVVGAPQFPASSWRGSLLLIFIAAAIGPLIYRLVQTTMATNRALRRSETEFRAAFEDAPVGMAVTGLHGDTAHRFVRVNRALCEMFGRTAEELTSVRVAELTCPDDRDMTAVMFDRATDPDVPHRIEKRYLHKSGRTIWASVSYSVVTDEHGTPTHLVSQIEDIGDRRESDQVLLDAFETDREANERLRQLERIRSEMASTVSHELRTPLTSAAGYVELLVEGDAGPLTAEQRDMLDTVARSLTRLDGIVDDVLDMASPGHPSPLDPGSADLDAVLRSAVASVAVQAATRGQDLRTSNDLAGAVVTGNAGRLERVIINLLTNAVKFTPVDGVITVVGRHNGGEATIEVTDDGIGISPEDQDRIFERFFRTGPSANSAASGTGLGLAIAQTITTQYGGKLTVSSAPGAGSTFTLTLPTRSTALTAD
jgi:PAS domain S-box-containing protein